METVERRALIFNVQKYNLYDGPGTRTIVFFKGCPLRCRWCSNPEGQLRRFQILFKRDMCVDCGACAGVCPKGIHAMADGHHSVRREPDCIGCGRCAEACPRRALTVTGEQRSISELLSIVEEDLPFYRISGGGVTLGGGEVLMQPEAAANLLAACRNAGINTAIETCGYAKPETVRRIAPLVDLFLFDIKHMDPEEHARLTGVRNEMILDNLRWLFENGFAVKVRMPVLKGLNDDEKEFMAVADFLEPYRDYRNFKGVDILPYHKMGVNKYAQLDMDYPLEGDPVLTDEDMARMEGYMTRRGITAAVIRH